MEIISIYLIGLLGIKYVNTCEVRRTEQEQVINAGWFLIFLFFIYLVQSFFPTSYAFTSKLSYARSYLA